MLNITMVYQDRNTQTWASEVGRQMAHLIGTENVHVTSWQISDLIQSELIADTVWSAARADIIIVAVSAQEEVPAELCAWIDAWLPRRVQRSGSLVVLTVQPAETKNQMSPIKKYLLEIAQKGHLDFIPHERKMPDASGDLTGKGTVPDSPVHDAHAI